VERTLWTDERMDDAIARIDSRFDQVDRRFDQIDRRFQAVDRRFEALEHRMDRGFEGVAAEFRGLRGYLAASNRQLTQIGWALVGILFVQLIAAVVAFA
jgi:hypothetical protein